jgi:crotonobetainyl-CoA:carnitine CoA-transferase CaiB-like acyl-CoA transferase
MGIKAVEFTEIIAGPLVGMLLADMGAEVIKVEPPWGNPWRFTQPFLPTESRPFMAYNRGKRSLTMDLTTSEAQDLLRRLIPQVDVALLNYRSDPLRHRLLESLGLTDIRFGPGYDPQSTDAIAFGQRLIEQAEKLFRQKTTAAWLTIFEGRGISAGPVRFVEELFDDPQVRANELVTELEHQDAGKVKMVGQLARFSGIPLSASASPVLASALMRFFGS